jgi:2-polyprenyl-3-methyl-5-hydroxy-6-metoxy-1,4-benzoquinol methylase
MNDKRLNIWYKDDQFKNQFSTNSQKEIVFNRWKYFKKIILKHNFKKQQLRILDLGSGDGVNILGLNSIMKSLNFNYEIYASDYSQDRLDKLSKRFPEVKTLKFDISNEVINNKYDLILFNHVLEHIKNENQALYNLKALLKKDGLMILGVPNEGCLIAQIRNKICQRKILKYTDHVNFYTMKSLKSKISPSFIMNSSFREGFFMPHDSIQRALRKFLLGRYFLNLLLFFFPSQSAGLILGLSSK